MRLQSVTVTTVVMLAPAPVALLLVGESFQGLAGLDNSAPLMVASALLSAVLFALAYLTLSPWLTVGRNTKFGASATAGAMALYLFGSFEGSSMMHWLAIVLIYPSLVLLLGGRAFALSVLPSALVLGLVPFVAPEAPVGLAIAYSAGILSAGSLLFHRARNRDIPEDCERCASYRDEGRSFCLFCGKCLSWISVGLRGRRLVALAAFTIILALAFQISLSAVAFGPSGLQRIDYGLAGAQSTRATVLPMGWKVVSQEQYQSALGQGYFYSLSDPTSTSVNVRIGISNKQGPALSVALQGHNGTLIGSVETPLGELPMYNLSEGTKLLNGLLYSDTVNIESNNVFTSKSVAYVIDGAPGVISPNDTSRADSVLTTLSNSTNYSVSSAFFTQVVASPLLSYPIAAGVTASVYGMGLVAASVMSVSVDSASRLENSMGLTEEEFALFSSLPRSGSGREVLEKINGSGFTLSWPQLQNFLARLESMKLMGMRLQGGNPAMIWSKRES